jgi:hypothetical protein
MMGVRALFTKALDSLKVGIGPSDLLDTGAFVFKRTHNGLEQRIHIFLVLLIHDAFSRVLVGFSSFLLFIVDVSHLIGNGVLVGKVLSLVLKLLSLLGQLHVRPSLVLFALL